jgi:hypothetical protein
MTKPGSDPTHDMATGLTALICDTLRLARTDPQRLAKVDPERMAKHYGVPVEWAREYLERARGLR